MTSLAWMVGLPRDVGKLGTKKEPETETRRRIGPKERRQAPARPCR